MDRIHRASRRARRRRLLADSIDRLGLALSVAVAIGLLAVVVSRLIGEPLAWWWAAGPPVAVGVIMSLAIAWRRRLTDLQAATDVDTALNLRDRLGSAIELESLDRDDPFVQLLERDADEAAGKVNIADATPIRFGNSWLTWPALAGLLVLAVMFMPTYDLLGRQKAAQKQAQQEAQVEEAANTIDDLIEETKQALAEIDPTLEESEELEDILEDIKSQLEQGELTPEEAEALADAAMDEKAKQLEEEAAQAETANDLLDEMLAETIDPDNPDTSDFEKALNSGDFESAAEALSELQKKLSEMSEQERQALAESMSQMADRLNQAAKNRQAQKDAMRRMAQELQAMGLSKEMAEQLANSGDAQQIAEQLQAQGIDPAEAQRLAQRMAQQKRASDSRNAASRSAQSLAKALKQASKGAKDCSGSGMGELGEELEGLSAAELEGQLAALAAQGMSKGGGVGGSKAGEGSIFNEQIPMSLGKSLTEDVENRKGGGKGEVAMRYTTERPTDWVEGASDAPMRAARLREAAKAAEQAIEEQAISPRYRQAIRDYFERAQKVAPPADNNEGDKQQDDDNNEGDQESQ